jgi:integrase
VNRLTEEQIAAVLPLVLNKYPFYAPVIYALYTTGLRFGHGVALMYAKMSADGVVKVDQKYDDKGNKFESINKRKNVPAEIGFEPVTLELIRGHRRWLMRKDHDGLKTGLLFPSERGDRPIGNDQLNDVWREAQVAAGIERPVTIHGLRHTFHDIARQQGVPDAVVKTMAGRAGTEVVRERGKGTHLHYSRGVTVEEMRQASIAVMSIIPTGPVGTAGRDSGRDAGAITSGRDSGASSVTAIQP